MLQMYIMLVGIPAAIILLAMVLYRSLVEADEK